MSARRSRLEHLAPWLGIAAAVLAWGLAHQVSSDSIFDDCARHGAAFVLVTGLLCLALDLAGGFVSFDVWRREPSEGRRFLGLVGAMLAALAAFAIMLQAVSSLILPTCAV